MFICESYQGLTMTIRAFYRAAAVDTAVAPYNTITLKIYYPATPTDSDAERNTGVIPAAEEQAPFPVVIFMPGINVGPEAYHWLALALAEKGLVVVLYCWIAEEMPGHISLTPGVDLTAVSPEAYGRNPTCPALHPILNELARLQEDSVLAGLLDLECVILGGHSAGGTMALQNANPQWFPQVKGAFSYAGHTMASTFLGYAPGTILPISDKLPLLILGGTNDGVIEASAHRYKLDKASATQPLERTFTEGITSGNEDKLLVILEGANHFSIVYPIDESTGRPFLDNPTSRPDSQIRAELTALISFFIEGYVLNNPKSKIVLKQQLTSGNPLIAFRKTK